MNKLLTLFFMVLSTSIIAQNANFFVHAHQDDAVYFSGVQMFNTLKSLEKTTFIIISASDQGAHDGVLPGSYDTNEFPSPVPFYEARDNGLKKAIQYCVTDAAFPKNYSENTTTVTIQNKQVRKWEYGSTAVAYFLDLPNGECCSFGAGGYPANNNENLEQLRKGQIPSITNVTGTTTYNNWDEIVATVKGIYNREKGTSNKVYTTDVDLNVNPGDHTDHYMSGVLAIEAMNSLSNFDLFLHVDYNLTNLTPNLSPLEIVHKSSTFGAMINGTSDKGYNSNRHFHLLNWFIAEYIRSSQSSIELSNLNPLLQGNTPNPGNGNIALNKPTTASGQEPGRLSSYANDNNFSISQWWANDPYAQWWRVDLQDVYDVNQVKVFNYYDGSRYYQYDIEASLDGINWAKIVDFNNNTSPATAQGNSFDLNNQARYLRVNMNFNSANLGVHIIEFQAFGTLATPNNNTINIALNKPTTASGQEPGRLSSYANDNDFSISQWWANDPYAQWWRVDLQDVYDVNQVKVFNYYDDSRYYQYDIEASLDGNNWTQIVDFNGNTSPATAQGNSFDVNNQARYLRVNMNFNSVNIGVHIIEFQAFGALSSSNRESTADDEIGVLKISPNPSGDEFSIDLSAYKDKEVLYFLSNLSGKVLMSGTFVQNHLGTGMIDLSHFDNGTYLISLSAENIQVKTAKLVLLKN